MISYMLGKKNNSQIECKQAGPDPYIMSVIEEDYRNFDTSHAYQRVVRSTAG